MERLKKEVYLLLGAILLGIISFFYDKQIAIWFKSVQNSMLTVFFKIFDPLVFMLVLYGILIFLVWRKTKLKWTLPLVFTLIATLIASGIIKLIVMRNRPFGLIETFPIIHLIDYSFPSNHSAVIFSALPILNKELKKQKYLWVVLAGLIFISRLYLGVHYLSDLIFGSIIGYLIGLIVLRIKEKDMKKN